VGLESQCAICGTIVKPSWWVCPSCRRAYELPGKYADWPDWAKLLREDERARRRYEANWREYTVISLDEVEVLERIAYGDRNSDPIAERFLAG